MVRRVASSALIGREHELGRVAALRCEVAAAHSGVTVLLAGEAGVGKSRLLREIGAAARSEGWVALSGVCDEFASQSRPFAALANLIPALEVAFAQHLPDVLSWPVWEEFGAEAGMGSKPELLVLLLRKLADAVPVLVAIDDLHWADESSLDVFSHLARGLSESRVMVAAAFRPHEANLSGPLQAILASIHRTLAPELLELHPLTQDETEALVRAVQGPGAAVDGAALFQRSWGNPLLIEELLASPAGGVPAGVKVMVIGRLQRLSPEAREVAEAASVDTVSSTIVLATTSGLPAGRAALAIDELVGAGILTADNRGLAFRHPLIREAVADSIGPTRRSALHAARAEALEAHAPGHVGEIARHWDEAGEPSHALRSLMAAGQAAARNGAHPEAADAYLRALARWDEVPNPESAAGETRTDLVIHAGEALEFARRFYAAAELAGAELARPGHSAAERALLLAHRGRWIWFDEEMPRSPGEVLRAAVAALDHVDDPTIRARVLLEFARWAIPMGDEDGAESALGAVADSGLLAHAPRSVHALFGTISAHVATIRGREPGPSLIASPARPNINLVSGQHRENVDAYDRAMASYEERGVGTHVGIQAAGHMASSHYRLGEYELAMRRFDRIVDRFGIEPWDSWASLSLRGWGLCQLRMGTADLARRWLPQAARVQIPTQVAFLNGAWAMARVLVARLDRDPGEAERAIADALAHTPGHTCAAVGEPVAEAIGYAADLAFAAGQRLHRAEELTGEWILALDARLQERPEFARIGDFAAYLAKAKLEARRLIGPDDADAWRRLAADWEAMPRPFEAAYARFRAAWACLRGQGAGGREAAAADLASAGVIAASIGAGPLLRECDDLARIAGIQPKQPETKRQEPPPDDVLTAREREVLQLVALGRSNGQVAIALGISTKTASVHVSNILAKLGATNRVEAALLAHRRGIVRTAR
ncbi:MAG: helix-turn-helix transcriptional regulator [Dehalococcoidia bacterium]